MTTTKKNTTDWTAIDTAIGKIPAKDKALGDYIQKVLVQMVAHWQAHGDVKGFVERANKISQMELTTVRMNSVRQWFVDRGIVYNQEEKVFKYSSARTTNEENIKYLPHWTKAQKEADFQPLDGWAEVEKLRNKLAKRMDKGVEGDTHLKEALAQMDAILKAKSTTHVDA